MFSIFLCLFFFLWLVFISGSLLQLNYRPSENCVFSAVPSQRPQVISNQNQKEKKYPRTHTYTHKKENLAWRLWSPDWFKGPNLEEMESKVVLFQQSARIATVRGCWQCLLEWRCQFKTQI